MVAQQEIQRGRFALPGPCCCFTMRKYLRVAHRKKNKQKERKQKIGRKKEEGRREGEEKDRGLVNGV